MPARGIVRALVYVWAAPTTLVGLTAGAITLASGGRVQIRSGALEFHGGFARWFLERRVVSASAMTLGHVILGRDPECLDSCRDHEQVHVRQVERWGVAFLPAYVVASIVAQARGRHYYFDNWFERDARQRCGEELFWGMVPPRTIDRGASLVEKTSPPPHREAHFTASESVRDVVIGMADGLTVPFAIAAGLTGNAATAVTTTIVTVGLAEIAAGSIAMGLGGYLAARSDAEHYQSERAREEREVSELPDSERAEVAELFRSYGLNDRQIEPILHAFEADPKAWVDFMMRYELGLEEPQPGRAWKSAATIAGAYIAGGMIPLFPYMILADARRAVLVSVAVTMTALAGFGYLKGRSTGTRPLRSALHTAVIGGLAAAAAFLIAGAFSPEPH